MRAIDPSISKKITVDIDPDDCNAFTKNKFHGQISQIIRKFIRVIVEMDNAGEIDKFNAWAYGNKSVTLKQPKEE